MFRLTTLISKVREVDPEMAPQTLAALLYAAVHPGCTVGEMAEAQGLTSGTGTRIVARLGDWARYQHPGLKFVTTEQDAKDRRFLRVFVTPAGQRFIAGLLSQMD
jgi:DNA-binding MarR family transcriptional regulator